MVQMILVALCLALNAYLSAAEMALVTLSKAHLREMIRKGFKRAELVLRLREAPERTLSVIQIGITLVGALAAAVSGAGAEENLSPWIEKTYGLSAHWSDTVSILLIVAPLTVVNVLVGELIPKSLALRDPLKISMISAPWFVAFDRILGPVVSVFEWSTKRILTLIPHRPNAAETESAHFDLEALSLQSQQYAMNLAAVEKKRVKDIMLSWAQVSRASVSMEVKQVEDLVVSSGHTRLPVTHENRVIGLLNTKEFSALRRAGGDEWMSIVRDVQFFQAATPAIAALKALQARRRHMGVVIEGEQVIGIVTLEDIVEEVIGEIYDEDDDGAIRKILSAAPQIRSMTPGTNRS
jgi:putative hemolysin